MNDYKKEQIKYLETNISKLQQEILKLTEWMTMLHDYKVKLEKEIEQ